MVTRAERATNETILEAAAELFAERGYAGTTTRALAERAGVNEVTVFRHFKSKQGVLAALGELVSRESAGFAVAALPDPADVRRTLQALALQEIRQAAALGVMVMRLALEARSEPEVAEVMGEAPGQNRAGLVAYLKERQAAGDLRGDLDPGVMAEAFFALTALTVMTRQVLGEPAEYKLSLDEVGAQLFELFWSGVAMGATPRGGEHQ